MDSPKGNGHTRGVLLSWPILVSISRKTEFDPVILWEVS